jgi:hypothetical protein
MSTHDNFDALRILETLSDQLADPHETFKVQPAALS